MSGIKKVGETITLISPTKTGYTFKGWIVSGAGAILSGDSLTMGYEDVTVTATWELSTYIVSYDFNDGDIFQSFEKPGEYTFVAPYTGRYKLEVWGAEGGGARYLAGYLGGYGGYSKGEIYLEKGETLYVNVGGMGNNYYSVSNSTVTYINGNGYNGGGAGTADAGNSAHGAGGGATHIAKVSGLLSSLEDYKEDILIVAGGGGGAAAHSGAPSYSGTGGSGGGYKGVNSIPGNTNVYCNAGGGTQDSGGLQSDGVKSACTNHGLFGMGSYNGSAGSGGGSGFYGGAAGVHGPAAGGSGYIGNELLENKVMYCYNCEESDEESTKTISTTDVSTIATSNYAKNGNGEAKITFLSALSTEVTYGDKYDISVTPSRKGYRFIGWNTKPDGSGETITNDTKLLIEEDHTLYAMWEETTLYIYNNGNEYSSDITGGIKKFQWVGGSWGSPTATVTMNTDSITCTVTRSSDTGYHAFATIYTGNKMSLQDYNKLVVTFNSVKTEGYISISSKIPTNNEGGIRNAATTANVAVLDISDIDEGYIVVGARTDSRTITNTCSIVITSIYLEQ